MAIALVGTPQVGFDGSASTTVASAAKSTTSGNSLLVGCMSQEGSGVATISGVTDTAGNTFTALTMYDDGAGGGVLRWFYCHNITGDASNIVTGTWSTAERYKHIIQIEISGAKNQAPVADVSGVALPGATVSASVDMGSAIGAIFSIATSSNDRTWTPGAGFTEINDWGTSGAADYYTGFNATGAVSTGMTASSASSLLLGAVGFEQAGGPIIPPIIHHLRQQGIA